MGLGAVFIDGGYFNKVLHHEFDEARIHYQHFAEALVDPESLFRTYYYDCPPYRSNPPTAEEMSRYSGWHSFRTALLHMPRLEFREGLLALRGRDASGRAIFVQKQVDCQVGVDMALLATKGKITSVALVSGDSDFVPAIAAVKQEGILVTLWHGTDQVHTRPGEHLLQICDEVRPITRKLIDRSKLHR